MAEIQNDFLISAIIRKARRERAKNDILFFAQYYLSHILQNETPLFHKEILRLLQTENRLGIAAPRGFAKSTITQIIYGIHCLLFNKGEDILIISQSSVFANDYLRKVKMEFENNERLKNDFGMLLQWGEKESKRWTADHIVIQQDGNVFSQAKARGRGCQVRGLRPTKVICDDLENEEQVRSEEQRKFLREWFLGSLLNTLKLDQQLIVIGTILHPLALIAEIIDKKDTFEKWETRKYKALENGKSLWPSRFPVKDLLARKAEIGTYAFESEYQNNPISSDTCLWKPDWIKTYEKRPKMEKVFAALDPATSTKESSDYSAIVVMGIGEDGNIYEVHSLRGHWGMWELIDKIIDVQKKFQPIRFGIEEGALTNIIRPVLIKKTEQDKSLRIPLESISLGRYTGEQRKIKQATDKYSRALSVIHYWEQGAVYLKNQDLIDEISTFPTGQHDDFVDACVYCVKMIMKYSPISVMVKREERNDGEIKSFSIVNDQMPCLAPPISETFGRVKSNWKLGI
jgi:predicted phage terminase large subunit-like protein